MPTPRSSLTRPLNLAVAALAVPSALAGAVAWWWDRQLLPVEEQVLEMKSPFLHEKPAAVPAEANTPELPVQLTADGTGPLFYRRYEADIVAAQMDAEALMAQIKNRLGEFVPPVLVRVEKRAGKDGTIDVGDEYFFHLFGPWDAPVRVIQSLPNSFAFVTLRSHLEAGEILFRCTPHPQEEGRLRFEIVEWTRSRDRWIDLVYDSVELLKAFQRGMWVYFCSRVVEASGGQLDGKIGIFTQQSPFPGEVIPIEGKPLWQQYTPKLKELRDKSLNFDREQKETYTQETGWHLDDYCVELPAEAPGEPAENGSWQIARRIIHNYEFPDPAIIKGIFVPEEPLEERVLLLKARWLFFTFYFGTRVGDVIDEVREEGARGPARVWGYSYQTLEEHIEQGEMTFEVWKFLESGEVEFRIQAYSRVADDINPFYRLGFRLFGRALQKRYAGRSLERMEELVKERLQDGGQGPEQAAEEERPEIKQVSKDSEIGEKIETLQEKERGGG